MLLGTYSLTFRDCFSHKRHCLFVYFLSTFLPLPHSLFLSLSPLHSLSTSPLIYLSLHLSCSLFYLSTFPSFTSVSLHLALPPPLSSTLLAPISIFPAAPLGSICVSLSPYPSVCSHPPRANIDLQTKCSFPFLTQP